MNKTFGAMAIVLACTAPVRSETLGREFAKSIGEALTKNGVATITFRGEDVIVKLDYTKLAEQFLPPPAAFSMSPMTVTMHPTGDGKWHLSADQALDLHASQPGAIDVTYTADHMTLSGDFDEAAPWLFSVTGGFSDIKVMETLPSPEGIPTVIEVALENQTVDIGITEDQPGYTFTTKLAGAGLREVVKTGGKNLAPPIVLTAASLGQEMKVTHVRGEELAYMLKVGKDVPKSGAAAFWAAKGRELTLAAMPLFEQAALGFSLDGLKVETPEGELAFDHFGFAADLPGLVESGYVHGRFDFAGAVFPKGGMPPGADAFLPSEGVFDGAIKGLNFRDFLMAVMDDVVSGKDTDEPAESARLENILAPGGEATIELHPVSLGSDLYQVTSDTDMVVQINKDRGKFTSTIKLTGLDAILEQVKALPKEISGEAMPVLMMARGFAKAEGDALVWVIDYATDPESMTINGTKLK